MEEETDDSFNLKDVIEVKTDVPQEELPEEEPAVFKPFKVFINHVDSYHSKYITAYIADQIYGMARLMQPADGEEALDEEAAQAKPTLDVPMPTDKYEFIGTLSKAYRRPSEDIHYVIGQNNEAFREEILNCGFIIYDITKFPNEIPKALNALTVITEKLDEVQKLGPKTYESFNEDKIFILISPIMTWALTKPIDPSDPDLPFSEVDYRRRRPHPNYKTHYNCEKEVMKIGQKYKDKLKTYVVCSGITYGEEEDTLKFFFKMAWYNEVLPIFDTGKNKVPFIHVRDLAKALHGLMERTPSKPQYILAVEQTPTSFKEFIRNLSRALSDGKTVNIVSEEAFLYNDMTQGLFEKCTVNLSMEPVFLVENLQLEWQSELNIVENMNQIVHEFKTKSELKPIKMIVLGPPASGKTRLARKLCEFYNSKYISIPTMLEEFIQIWKDDMVKPEKPKPEETEYLGEEEIEPEEEEEPDLEQLLEQIREVQMFMEGGIEKIPDNYLAGLLKTYLAKNFCQNRGYVIDGYPQITAQARELFGQSQDGGGAEEEEAETVNIDKILPDVVISLVATDEFITHRVMRLQEEEIKDTPLAEDNLLERLEKYRENNTDENTVLNFFDELEIDLILAEAKNDDFKEAFELIREKFPGPSTFGLTPEEEEELHRIEQEEKNLAMAKAELNKQMLIEKAEAERKNKMEAWAEMLEKLQMEEEKILVAQSEPLRHYLMKYVFPVLTKGLIEVATLKPEDPVDYLAEYLFRENPEGRMFDPSYNVECEDLYGEFRGYIEKIIQQNEAFEK